MFVAAVAAMGRPMYNHCNVPVFLSIFIFIFFQCAKTPGTRLKGQQPQTTAVRDNDASIARCVRA